MRFFSRLQWKLTAAYTCATSALAMIFLLLLFVVVWGAATSSITTSLASSILTTSLTERVAPLLKLAESHQALSELLQGRITNGHLQLSADDGSLLFTVKNVDFVWVVDANGIIVAAEPQADIGQKASELLQSAARSSFQRAIDGSAFLNPAYRDNNGIEHIFIPIRESGETVGVLAVAFQALANRRSLFLATALTSLIPLMIPVICVASVIGTLFGIAASRGVTKRLSKLAVSAESWAKGDFSAVVRDTSQDEIGQLGQQLNVMAAQLENQLNSRSHLAMVEERNRIARDLHDSAKQQIFATTMQLSTAKVLMDIDPKQAKQHLAEAEQLAKQVQQELSGLIQELRPAQLEGKGLFVAIRDSAEAFERQNNIPVDLRIQGERELPLHIEQAMFRIMQEALANIVKHSQASQIDLTLTVTNDGLTLAIHDDGVGFEQTQVGSGIGLYSMKERIEALNGKLRITSSKDKGTTVTVTCPL
ncbi:MAG: histidine kinase [Candidatus Promineifilaceae bacterium]